MMDALKTLFENDVVSEEVEHKLKKLGKQRFKKIVSRQLLNYVKNLLKSMSTISQLWLKLSTTMLSERLAEEIAEFAEDRKQLAEAKAKYAVAQRENASY